MTLKVFFPTWAGLGFYRGVKYYNYCYRKNIINYEKKIYYEKPVYFYSECFSYGLFGVLLYANPITIFAVIPKEIYRLEITIRGLHEEKEKEYYYKIM